MPCADICPATLCGRSFPGRAVKHSFSSALCCVESVLLSRDESLHAVEVHRVEHREGVSIVLSTSFWPILPSGARAHLARPRGACAAASLLGGRLLVGPRIPHDGVDDPEALAGDGLQRRVAPHLPRAALAVVAPEAALRADERVAGEDQGVLRRLAPAPLRPGRPHAGAGPAVGRGDPAVARELVAAGEQGDVDAGHQGRGRLRADAGHREQAPVVFGNSKVDIWGC